MFIGRLLPGQLACAGDAAVGDDRAVTEWDAAVSVMKKSTRLWVYFSKLPILGIRASCSAGSRCKGQGVLCGRAWEAVGEQVEARSGVISPVSLLSSSSVYLPLGRGQCSSRFGLI